MENVQTREGLAALKASVGLFAGVAASMARQVFLARKGAIADVALDLSLGHYVARPRWTSTYEVA